MASGKKVASGVVKPLKRKPKELIITLTYRNGKFIPHRAVRVKKCDTLLFEFSTDLEDPKMTITFQDKTLFRPARFKSDSPKPITVEDNLKKRSHYDCVFSGKRDGEIYHYKSGAAGNYGGFVDP
jgi:hypothetical protein